MYTSTDGTTYRQFSRGLYSLVEVASTNYANIQAAYKQLNDNLLHCFQPINFALSGGVLVETPTECHLLHSITEREGGLQLRLFDMSQAINVPNKASQIALPQEVLLEPALFTAGQTSFFNLDNTIDIGNNKISAWLEKDKSVLSIHGDLAALVQGELVAYNSQLITVRYADVYKTFKLKTTAFNVLLDMLPDALQTFLSQECGGIVLVGLTLLGSPTPLLLHTIRQQGSSFILQVATIANPGMKFELQLLYTGVSYVLIYKGHQLQTFKSTTTKLWRYL